MNYFAKNASMEPTPMALELSLPKSAMTADTCVPTRLEGWLRDRLIRRLVNLQHGSVVMTEAKGEEILLGRQPVEGGTESNLTADVLVNRSRFFSRVMLGGTMGAAESYIDGDWRSDNLTDLIRVMIRNLSQLTTLEKYWGRWKGIWNWRQHLSRHNSITGSRKNIHEHYDLGNHFYQLFLDSTMNYSSAIFQREDLATGQQRYDRETLREASVRKMDRICEKLQLRPSDHVLEIGTGWGGLALQMAARHGCRVTTTTISEQQFRFATERIRAAGLSDRVTVVQRDYRELEGTYDKLVSIEMIEAVGHQYYDCFFEKCQQLLKPQGLMLLQAITMSEQNYQYHIRHVDFIRRYIFPGGCLPAISALQTSIANKTDWRMLHQEDITPHYVHTLACWRAEFLSRLKDVRSQGYSEKFIRLWHFYLCYCEAAFAERRVHNLQLVYCRPDCPVDPAIDYCF